MRAMILTATLLLAPVCATAAEPSKAAPSTPHYIDISTVALPIMWRGRLVNYIFTRVRVDLAPNADAAKLTIEKEPFLRDALVRLGARTSFTLPWDFTHIDARALAAAMKPEAERVVGRGLVRSVSVVDATPKQLSGLPKRPAASTAPA